MNITKTALFELLNGHYLTTGDKINESYLNESIILAVDNTRWIYDQMRDNRMLSATSVAFLGFQDIAKDIIRCNDYSFVGFDLGPVLVEWLCEFGHGYASLAESIVHVENERKELTMKNTIETTENDVITCAECGCIIESGDIHEVDGEHYCDECFEEKFFVCCECDGVYRRDGSEVEYDGDIYCEDCFNDSFVLCHDCEEFVHINDATYIDYPFHRYHVCPDCLDRFYTKCERCGDYILNDNSYNVYIDEDRTEASWCENCWEYHTWTCEECGDCYSDGVPDHEYVCPSCHGEEEQDCDDIAYWNAPSGVRSYSYKPTACFCPSYTENQIFYGFELEAEAHGNDSDEWADKVNENLGYTYVKHDGSLNDGMEIVSHPATLEYHMSKKDDYERIFREMRAAGWRSHDDGTCGLHVHISKKPMEEKNPFAINNLLIIFDRFWDKLVIFSRRKDHHLDRWAKRYGTVFSDYKGIKDEAKRYGDRYMAVNLKNDHTVEIRMFRGTLNPDTFFATLQLVDVIVNKAIELGANEDIVKSITWNELIKSDHEELREYINKRFRKNGESDDVDERIEEAIAEEVAAEFDYHTSIRFDEVRIGDILCVAPGYGYGMDNVPGVVTGFEDPYIALTFDIEDLPPDHNCYFHNCTSSRDGTVYAPYNNGRWFTANELAILF